MYIHRHGQAFPCTAAPRLGVLSAGTGMRAGTSFLTLMRVCIMRFEGCISHGLWCNEGSISHGVMRAASAYMDCWVSAATGGL